VFNEVPCHKDVLGNWAIDPYILNLGTRWRWVASFMPPAALSQGKSPWYLLDRRLGGLHSRSVSGGEKKKNHFDRKSLQNRPLEEMGGLH
jgi:hypothetical protein